MQTDCGYTPMQICEMTFEDLDPLFAHWKRYPPLRDLVAGFIGFKPASATEEPKHLSADDMQRLMRATGGKMPT